MIDTLRTMVFPNIIWVIIINSLFISIQGAAGQTGSSILIASGFVLSFTASRSSAMLTRLIAGSSRPLDLLSFPLY